MGNYLVTGFGLLLQGLFRKAGEAVSFEYYNMSQFCHFFMKIITCRLIEKNLLNTTYI